MSRDTRSDSRGEMKRRLDGATESALVHLGSLARQMNRGSRSSDIVLGAAKAFASLEGSIDNTESTLKRMGLVAAHLSFQADAIQRAVLVTRDVEETLDSTREKLQFLA